MNCAVIFVSLRRGGKNELTMYSNKNFDTRSPLETIPEYKITALIVDLERKKGN